MKKCAILTITVDLMNYGNRLQNYALHEALKHLGCEVQTVNYIPVYEKESYNMLNSTKIKSENKMYKNYKWIIRKIYYLRNRKLLKEKRQKYNNFLENNISFTKNKYTINSDLKELSRCFDYFICGSDQVWNPYWEGTNPIYFMGFVEENKRIAYAASFGVSNIPNEKKDYYKKNINLVKYISCREKQGVNIIKELTNRDVIQVLDPVFLIEKDEWNKIAIKPNKFRIKKKYMLVYFLGDISKEYAQKIKEYKNLLGLDIIYLDSKEHKKTYFASPDEFIFLIKNASFVCTDSFHGCAFSIIFDTPFVICERQMLDKEQSMSSRIILLTVFS